MLRFRPNIAVTVAIDPYPQDQHTDRGHRVEDVWVVGGVERTAERRVFLVAVENRGAETMRDVISRHVKGGSIIYTDMWRGYNGIDEGDGYEHHTVNHSIHFRERETG